MTSALGLVLEGTSIPSLLRLDTSHDFKFECPVWPLQLNKLLFIIIICNIPRIVLSAELKQEILLLGPLLKELTILLGKQVPNSRTIWETILAPQTELATNSHRVGCLLHRIPATHRLRMHYLNFSERIASLHFQYIHEMQIFQVFKVYIKLTKRAQEAKKQNKSYVLLFLSRTQHVYPFYGVNLSSSRRAKQPGTLEWFQPTGK